jgi:hypothetical protein
VLSHKVGHISLQGVARWPLIILYKFKQGIDGPGFVPSGKSIQQFRTIFPRLPVKAPHHAIVDVTNHIVRKYKDIPWMRICMEKTMLEDLFKD